MNSSFPQENRSSAPPFLEVRGLCKSFQVNGSTAEVLEQLSFRVKRGELICLLGRSGCGKTTLLNIIAGFTVPTSGEVLVEGNRITKPGPDRCVVFQTDALFPWLTVEENISFGLKSKEISGTSLKAEVDRFLSLVGLSEFKHYLPREISGGMKQRVALARVLIRKPKILLMDEPFCALDPQTREEMQSLLLTLWAQLAHTIVFVTHEVSEALLLADRIFVIGNTPGGIKEETRVELPRPRMRAESEFTVLERKLYLLLRP